MRGSRAKQIRRHVATRYAFLSKSPLYWQRATGITLAVQCQRAIYQKIKQAYKKQVRLYGTV